MLAQIMTNNKPGDIEAKFAAWQLGYRLGEDGKPITACNNAQQRQGWRDHQIATVGSSLYLLGVPAELVDAVIGRA